MALEKAQTWHSDRGESQARNEHKRPFRSSSSHRKENGQRKKPRPDDEFSIQRSSNETISPRDPYKQALKDKNADSRVRNSIPASLPLPVEGRRISPSSREFCRPAMKNPKSESTAKRSRSIFEALPEQSLGESSNCSPSARDPLTQTARPSQVKNAKQIDGNGPDPEYSRDPRRRARMDQERGSSLANEISTLIHHPLSPSNHRSQWLALQTPPISTESEIHVVEAVQPVKQRRINDFPLSPRSKSPESDETQVTDDEEWVPRAGDTDMKASNPLTSCSLAASHRTSSSKSRPTSPTLEPKRPPDLTVITSTTPDPYQHPSSPTRMSFDRHPSAPTANKNFRDSAATLTPPTAIMSTLESTSTIPTVAGAFSGLAIAFDESAQRKQKFKAAESKFNANLNSLTNFVNHGPGLDSINHLKSMSHDLKKKKDQAEDDFKKCDERKRVAINTVAKALEANAINANCNVVTQADLAELKAQFVTRNEFEHVRAENISLKEALAKAQSRIDEIQAHGVYVKSTEMEESRLAAAELAGHLQACQSQIQTLTGDVRALQARETSQERQLAPSSGAILTPDQEAKVCDIAEGLLEKDLAILRPGLERGGEEAVQMGRDNKKELTELQERVSGLDTFYQSIEKKYNTLTSPELSRQIAVHWTRNAVGAEMGRVQQQVIALTNQVWEVRQHQANMRNPAPRAPSGPAMNPPGRPQAFPSGPATYYQRPGPSA